ncbi:hypothetical protein [Bacillus amyloliquefaciens]|uniref:hypothetical protein n=1 Tax=Bacillus amyloliquefaciens TaxID=1390 RepID=UPI001ABDB09D|nr:hypothetical protein [Bacillus amyloliquefaciens]QTG87315.1 hypothetical protein J4048_20530 [Bacillus amyloliquefaciens]
MIICSIEAIDGAGKTTVFERLKEDRDINDGSLHIEYARFPTDDFYQMYKRLNKPSGDVFLNLHNEDKRSLVKSARSRGVDLLICDRGDVTQTVYNGQCSKDTMYSDLVIFLKTSVETAMKRIAHRGSEDIYGFETEDKLKHIANRYLRVLNRLDYRGRYVEVVTDNKTPTEVYKEVKGYVISFLSRKYAIIEKE